MKKARNNNNKPKGALPLRTSVVPAARNVRVQQRAPVITSSKRGTFITGHEEIATVFGSVSFQATQYKINPGLPTYTWLSTQAKGWDKYKFSKLEFVYIPSEAVVTTPGSVYIVADFDPTDSPPQSLASMSTFETQSNGRVFEAVRLNVPSKHMFDGIQTKKIRCGPVSGDLQLYDAASVSICTISSTASPIGQLWVYYELELISRQTESTIFSPSSYLVYDVSTNVNHSFNVNTIIDFDRNLTSGFSVVNDVGSYTIPCGMYKFYGTLNLETQAVSTPSIGSLLLEILVDDNTLVLRQNTITDIPIDSTSLSMTVPFSFVLQSMSSTFTVSLNAKFTLANSSAGTFIVRKEGCLLFIEAIT